MSESRLRPYLVTAIMAGGDREETGPRAIHYAAEFTDHFLLLRTGSSADKLIALAREHVPSSCLTVIDDPRDPVYCAQGRNDLLRYSTELGATWMHMVDTDNECHARGFDVSAWLRQTTADTVKVWHESGDFAMPRFFRLPSNGKFVGEPHERWVCFGKTEVMPRLREKMNQRFRGDLMAVQRRVIGQMSPRFRRLSARELVLLGEAYYYIGPPKEAIRCYRRSVRLAHSHEDRAWGMYLAATMVPPATMAALRAAESAAEEYPTHPEILCLCADRARSLGLLDRAIDWAWQAVEAGPYQIRAGRELWAKKVTWYEGPYRLLADIYASIGEPRMSLACERMALELFRERWNF